MDEINVLKEILSDAIVVATETEKKCIRQKRIIIALVILSIALAVALIVR